MTLTEREYFGHLEMRISRELAGMRNRNLRSWWCDGFLPDAFIVVGDRSRINGKAWMVSGQHREELWTFIVHLGPARQRDEINWAALLPADDVTGWLSLDFETKFMKIDPFVTRLDGADKKRKPEPYRK